MNQEVKGWLEYAKMDLDGAELLNTANYPKPVELVVIIANNVVKKQLRL